MRRWQNGNGRATRSQLQCLFRQEDKIVSNTGTLLNSERAPIHSEDFSVGPTNDEPLSVRENMKRIETNRAKAHERRSSLER